MTDDFARCGYRVVRQLLPAAARSFVCEYALKSANAGLLEPGDSDVPETPFRYADPMMEALLTLLQPRVEEHCGRPLFPTYSYYRVYKQNDVLRAHRDRPSCEISVTICLGYEAEAPWPIWFEHDGAARRVDLEPGDGLLYRGVDLLHWRDRFEGLSNPQLFLHYVDRDGPYREWRFDQRPALGVSPSTERLLAALLRAPQP